jgi:protein-disulfide isomerase
VRRIHIPSAFRPRAHAFLVALIMLAFAPSLIAAQGEALAPRTKGRADAPIVIYEMSDFQCPFCRQFALETMPGLEREYIATGKVRFVFINLPMTSIHRNALLAAEVAMCAARQGRFWPVHDLLFKRQPEWSERTEARAYLIALADSAGASRATLAPCVTSGAARPAVDADRDAARRSGAAATPTFYIEGGLIDGAAPLEAFREVLDSIYRVKTAAAR